MKRILALLLAVAMVSCLFAGCQEKPAPTTEPATEATTEATAEATTEAAAEATTVATEAPAADAVKVAFVTDVGNIDDHSFNQYSYEGVTRFSEANNQECNYYKPAGDTDQDRIGAIEQAISDGYGVVAMAGFLFGPAVNQCALAHPDVLFLALDVTPFDMNLAEGEEVPANVSLITYKEEQAGYLAGYAAVVDGYKNLGFVGGIAVPAVVRYGYGFVQGAEAAAKDLGVTDVTMKYWYSNSFVPTDDIVTKMDSWYVDGTEIVFTCGGGIYKSCLNAADANEGLMIGVDVDQSPESDRIITSAMKALSNSVVLALNAAKDNGYKWPEAYAGKCQALGAAEDCIGLPMETSHFETFDQAKYDELYKAMADGSLVVDNSFDPEVKPVVENITVIYE